MFVDVRDVFGVLEMGAKPLYEGWISAHVRAEVSIVFRPFQGT